MSQYEFTVQTSFGPVTIPAIDAPTAVQIAEVNIREGLSFACHVKKGR